MPPSIPAFDARAPAADIAAALTRDGVAVVHNVRGEPARAPFMSELRGLLDASRPAKEYGAKAFYPGNTKRVVALVAKTEGVRGLVTEPCLLGLCDSLLLPNCDSYQLHVCSALVIGPGARRQVLHREDDAYPFFAQPRPNLVVASMLAMTDFTASNGATLVVPGSHLWAKGRQARPDEVVSATMPAGSLLVWMGGTLHAAGANTTDDDWRHGVFVSYSLGWLRSEENQSLDIPPAVAGSLSPRLRALAGYKMHGGSLGFYDTKLNRLIPNEQVHSNANLPSADGLLDQHAAASKL